MNYFSEDDLLMFEEQLELQQTEGLSPFEARFIIEERNIVCQQSYPCSQLNNLTSCLPHALRWELIL